MAKRIDQEKFLEIYRKSAGLMTTACEKYGCYRSTIYDMIKRDSEFARKIEEINEKRIDFAESKLMEKINEGDTTSILFFLKTKGRSRGYVEKHEVAVESDEEIKEMCREFFSK